MLAYKQQQLNAVSSALETDSQSPFCQSRWSNDK